MLHCPVILLSHGGVARVLQELVSRKKALANLVCFPFAGGGPSVYRDWPAAVPPWANVFAACLAGRERRLREPPISDLKPQVDELVQATTRLGNLPLVLFGHSLGAVLAAHVAQEVFTGPSSAVLIVAASRSPWFVPVSMDERQESAGLELTDERLEFLVTQSLGIERAAIGERMWREFLDLVRPALHADLAMAACQPYLKERSLDCPIHVLYGTDDKGVTLETVAGWERLTTGPTSTIPIPGGHFFLRTNRLPVLDAVMSALQRAVGHAKEPSNDD
jgi:pyochelin biosynthetic protein PchC